MNKKYLNILAATLLFFVFLQPFLAMRNFSPASDEISHLPSGYSYLKTGEIKLNPQHPPLIKILAALPLLFLDLKFNANDQNLAGSPTDEWQFGRNFLTDNGVDRVLFWGRIPMILLSVLLAWYVFKWGTALFGYKAGLIGLFIYALMPNVIAHSQFVTTDMGVAVFSFIALYYLWKFTQSSTKRNVILSGLVLGLALGSKFSAVFLLPVFFVLLAIYVQKNHFSLTWRSRIYLFFKIFAPILGLAVLVVWALYFFPKDLLFYWKGLKTVYADKNPSFQYFLNGDFKPDGWWYYFIWAFIIKTPVPFLIALFAAFARGLKNKLNFLDKSFILLPAALFLFVASWKAHNIGVRYILVIYPFLILFVSGWLGSIKYQVFSIKDKKLLTTYCLLLTALAGWYVFSSVNIYPDYLAYFNEIAGGPDNGYKRLDDSNIDWGQDLKRLAKYQKSNPDLRVVYTWDAITGASKMYGVRNVLSLNLTDQWWAKPEGKYAINTHALIRLELAAQKYENEKLNWRKLYKPIDRIGQSFFIYEF